MKFKLFIYILLLFLTPFAVLAADIVKASNILDGDTFITRGGEHIRLLGINTPEKARNNMPAQPFANEAKQLLTKLIKGKNITLKYGEQKRDKYKRLLAHIYLNDGTWVNAELIKQGMAHVYSFPDNRQHLNQLIDIEAIARKNKLGLWSSRRWQVLSANETFLDKQMGQFNLVKGKVLYSAKVKGVTYLNFGDDWRDDFTVEIKKHDIKLFKDAGISPRQYYQGKTLLVRGHLKPVNGVMITATHPEQLTVLD